MVLLLRLTVPELAAKPLARPPPSPAPAMGWAEPWAMVRALRVKLTLFTFSTCMLSPPSSVTLWPLPERVMLPLIESVLLSLISPLQAKVMTSPALSLLACATSACSWASELQSLTERVLWACAGRASPPSMMHRPMSKASPHSRRSLDERRVVFGWVIRWDPFFRCLPRLLTGPGLAGLREARDRKSTRLNSSHDQISYAVFCLKKKNHR